jgi:hypothetical protein
MNRGAFLAKVRAESGRTMVRSRRDRKLLVRSVVSDRVPIIYLLPKRSSRNGPVDPPPAKTVSMGLRHATQDPSLLSEGERGSCQATISLARL